VIRAIKPEIVVVELCRSRSQQLYRRVAEENGDAASDKSTDPLAMSGASFSLPQYIQVIVKRSNNVGKKYKHVGVTDLEYFYVWYQT
jgi:pheromone shutdown protein TraB